LDRGKAELLAPPGAIEVWLCDSAFVTRVVENQATAK
jgi:hypothetical protein